MKKMFTVRPVQDVSCYPLTRFSSFALTVFKWHEGKVGQFNTLRMGQALSYRTDDIILIPWQKKTRKDFLFEDTISD